VCAVKPRSSSKPGERYRRLPTGAHGLKPEEIERDQRERLREAIVELIVQKGYPAVRIVDITELAHVSRPTLYSLYANKEELLLAAYEDIAVRTTETVAQAYRTGGDSPEDSLYLGLRAFAELAAAEPEAMTLALLGAFGGGARALQRRNRTLHALEQTVSAGREHSWSEHPRDLTAKFLIGGIREVSATRLRRGRANELPDLADELGQWAIAYPSTLPTDLQRPAHAQPSADGGKRSANGEPAEQISGRGRRTDGPLPSGRHDLPREEVVNSQRERIVDATAAIVAEKGLAGLTIPEIASRANISHETFYEIYPTKHDAFLGAQKVGLHQALRITGEAYEAHHGDWPGGIAAGLRALIDYLCSEPTHAHLTLVDTFGASPETIDTRETALEAFIVYLRPGYELVRPNIEVPEVAAEAIAGGIWQVLHHYIEHKRIDELREATPQLIYAVLTPFLGPKEAAKVARR
jgi:AcrR family transcriptional regulator